MISSTDENQLKTAPYAPDSGRAKHQNYLEQTSSKINYFQETAYSIAQKKFRSRFIASLEEDCIEDGYHHPAEKILSNALQDLSLSAIDCLQGIFATKVTSNPSLAADILKCMGRIDPHLFGHGKLLFVQVGLVQPSIEVRESAVRLIEEWESDSFKETLEYFISREKVEWLRNYAGDVLNSLFK